MCGRSNCAHSGLNPFFSLSLRSVNLTAREERIIFSLEMFAPSNPNGNCGLEKKDNGDEPRKKKTPAAAKLE